MKPGYQYRYPPYLPYRTDTHTGFILIFFIQIPIPGIGTWYRYQTGYRSNSNCYIGTSGEIVPFGLFWHCHIISVVRTSGGWFILFVALYCDFVSQTLQLLWCTF